MATKTRPCIVLYKATGNPRERYDKPIGVTGFCIASFLKLRSGNKQRYLPATILMGLLWSNLNQGWL